MTCFKGVVMETFSLESKEISVGNPLFNYLFLKKGKINTKNKFIYSRFGLKFFYSDFPDFRTKEYIQVVTSDTTYEYTREISSRASIFPPLPISQTHCIAVLSHQSPQRT